MNRNLPIVFSAIIVMLMYTSCFDLDLSGVTVDPGEPPPNTNPLHIRNMSTTSGVIYICGQYPNTMAYHVYLDPSPQSGTPVDTVIPIVDSIEFPWWVERAIDSVVIDSGYVWMTCERWLLIEEDSGEWSCTWSDYGWEYYQGHIDKHNICASPYPTTPPETHFCKPSPFAL
ncbi:MAG: hypothetical protein JSV53_08655 [candidate division WOR-3 bacterium]|nr:MAG: hypothetical protein JSV53_08655 [candidate division WOR-3 bacterium]